MSIGFVYVIAFDDNGRFLMVKHVDRAWEMPGGRIEGGESPREAAVREFLEETGRDLELFERTLQVEGGLVFGGIVGKEVAEPRPEEIVDIGFFEELPDELSFPKVEYEKMIEGFSVLGDQI
jgi:8-oxo-dGTP pyrophosphatase MutT (NUDIX family)